MMSENPTVMMHLVQQEQKCDFCEEYLVDGETSSTHPCVGRLLEEFLREEQVLEERDQEDELSRAGMIGDDGAGGRQDGLLDAEEVMALAEPLELPEEVFWPEEEWSGYSERRRA